MQHIHEFPFEAESCEEAPGDFLDLDDLHDLLVHLEADLISLPPAPVDRLDQDGRAVSFEDALESVDIYLEVEKVLLCRFLSRVVGDMQLHELVERAETVTEGGVVDALLVRDHVVV